MCIRDRNVSSVIIPAFSCKMVEVTSTSPTIPTPLVGFQGTHVKTILPVSGVMNLQLNKQVAFVNNSDRDQYCRKGTVVGTFMTLLEEEETLPINTFHVSPSLNTSMTSDIDRWTPDKLKEEF